MPREKTVKIDLRISEREASRLNELMVTNGWNRSEAMRFLLNFGYVIMINMPAMLLETFLDSVEDRGEEIETE